MCDLKDGASLLGGSGTMGEFVRFTFWLNFCTYAACQDSEKTKIAMFHNSSTQKNLKKKEKQKRSFSDDPICDRIQQSE